MVADNARTVRLIVNADDFGYSDDTVDATLACFERGGLTSATIMAAMPATSRAIAYARAHPELSFGAHLTIGGSPEGDERPLLAPERVPTLTDGRGRFLLGDVIKKKAFARALAVPEIEAEMTAQLGLLRDHGVTLSHVDSHGHVHKFGQFVEALRRVLPAFGITRVRRGQNVWIRRPWKSPTFWVSGLWHPPIARHFVTTDRFFMPTCLSDTLRAGRVLRHGTGGTLEIGVHPGRAEAWRAAEAEAAPALVERAKASGWETIGWNALPKSPAR